MTRCPDILEVRHNVSMPNTMCTYRCVLDAGHKGYHRHQTVSSLVWDRTHWWYESQVTKHLRLTNQGNVEWDMDADGKLVGKTTFAVFTVEAEDPPYNDAGGQAPATLGES